MSFKKDWDVDQYKTEHECDEHWELRRSFMLAHRDKFPEDRLVCLAQVFTNVEFLGCRYPLETMQLVSSLSAGVADKYREKQKGRLQRTFVKASDAAGAKAKGLKRPLQEDAPTEATDKVSSQSNASSYTKHIENKPVTEVGGSSKHTESSHKTGVKYGPSFVPASQSQNSSIQSNSSANQSSKFDSSRYGGVKTYHIDQSSAGKQAKTANTTGPNIGGPFGKLVLIEPATEPVGAMHIISNSTSLCQVQMTCNYEQDVASSEVECCISVNEKVVGSARARSKTMARKVAADIALSKLKEVCYTIKAKVKYLSDSTIDKSLGTVPKSETECSDLNIPVNDNNVGSRLLRLMGWSGGGLGKDSQGISEPVSIQQQRVNRAGLGLGGSKSGGLNQRQFREKVQQLMRDFANSDSQYDLVFSSEFSNDERKTMHQIATHMKLKTKSYGKKDDRHLVVFKKRDMWETVEELFREGGSTERYDLIPPAGRTNESDPTNDESGPASESV
ncbi:CDKN2A-interacting protein isoform X2 [Periplaneta americana]